MGYEVVGNGNVYVSESLLLSPLTGREGTAFMNKSQSGLRMSALQQRGMDFKSENPCLFKESE